MIFWVTGLSGAGKTFLGKALKDELKRSVDNVVLVDGDEIRKIFGDTVEGLSYTVSARRKNAERIVEICKWLDEQNIHVVCCILCIFPDILDANRKRFSKYIEIKLQVPIEILVARDPKGLYRQNLKQASPNLVGIDIPYEPSPAADFEINNEFDPIKMSEEASRIVTEVFGHPDV